LAGFEVILYGRFWVIPEGRTFGASFRIAAYTIGIALLSTASSALRQMPPPEETGAARAPIAATSTAEGPSAER